MKRKSTFLVLTAIGAFTLLSVNRNGIEKHSDYAPIPYFSANPPTGKTGAPNESNCTDCHSGNVQSAEGVVDFTFNGLDSTYVPGQTYNLEIGVSSGTKTGFEMTILNSSNQKAGDFIAGTNSGTTLAGGREYIRHSASSGITSWQFQWTAPSTEMGNLRVFYAVNKANGNGNNGGDAIYIGDDIIYSADLVEIADAAADAFQVNTIWNAQTKQIHLDYTLKSKKRIYVTVQSLGGQLIQSTDLGYQSPGDYHQKLATDNLSSGLYIVSVFVNNRVFNKKIMLN